ncbi:uncharacterized protein LOC142985372 [Anticarsia gemmatalis]|uniref:uncharacterized protein LOC142985372 n=1 Tax=Anticarsia gemmatalis TaxID=129554 RepID=UPI003F76A3D2
MALGKLLVLGLQILLTIHLSESFMLLTVNIDDIKNLATKFVSESLAEKIANFIADTAKKMVTPEPEDRNVSEENKDFSIKQTASESDSEIDKTVRNGKNYRKDERIDKTGDERTDERGGERPDERGNERGDERNKKPIQYSYPLDQHKRSRPDEKKHEILKEDSHSVSFEEETTKKGNTVKPKYKKELSRYRLSMNTIDNNGLSDMMKSSIEEKVFRASDVTNKEAEEYDSSYQRSKIVATSGPIALTKLVAHDTQTDKSDAGTRAKKTWF